MRKLKLSAKKTKFVILSAIIILLIVIVPTLAVRNNKVAEGNSDSSIISLSVWQIDGFEGGKGSRSQYLKKVSERCFKNENIYVNVTALSADMARQNLENGLKPDLISYPAGFYGLETYFGGADFSFANWCNGAYCILTLDESADFSDVNSENTVINAGKDNLTEVAVAFYGLQSAAFEEPTNAYLKLLSGKYKYLFGTQRDAFRLKTRNAAFKFQAVTEFNDLYQNISITSTSGEKKAAGERLVEYILANSTVESLGLFYGNDKKFDDELQILQETQFEHVLNCPCSKSYVDELKSAAKNGDVNKIKNLLK